MCAAPVGESREGGKRHYKAIVNAGSSFIIGFEFKLPSKPFEVFVTSTNSRVPTQWSIAYSAVEIRDGGVIISLERPSNDVHWRLEFLSSSDFQIPDVSATSYEQLSRSEAIKLVEKSSVAFLGCARDCVDAVESSINNLQELGSLFKSSRIFIFENDSSDGTSELLRRISEPSGFYLLQEAGLDGVFPLRTQRLSYGRNRLFRHALTYSPDYIVVVDLDGIVDFSRVREGLISCMTLPDVWDAVFPVNSGEYFDLWALRHSKLFPYDYEFHMNDLPPVLQQRSVIDYVMRGQHLFDFKSLSGWLRVESAFGGMGIYKSEVFRYSSYRGDDENGVRRCEHVHFHESTERSTKRLYMNPNFVV
jgi:hypothetical protein